MTYAKEAARLPKQAFDVKSLVDKLTIAPFNADDGAAATVDQPEVERSRPIWAEVLSRLDERHHLLAKPHESLPVRPVGETKDGRVKPLPWLLWHDGEVVDGDALGPAVAATSRRIVGMEEGEEMVMLVVALVLLLLVRPLRLVLRRRTLTKAVSEDEEELPRLPVGIATKTFCVARAVVAGVEVSLHWR